MSHTQQVTVRLPLDIIGQLKMRSTSLAPYIVEAVREKLAHDTEAEIAASLRCLANDSEANDISDFAAAQDRVIIRGD